MGPDRSAPTHRRKHGWRSCASCKRRKQRCELPEASLCRDPSTSRLEEGNACRRCLVLGLDCVLDDFDKAARIAQERRKIQHAALREDSFVSYEEPTPSTSSSTLERSSDDTQPTQNSGDGLLALIEPIRTHPEDVSDWKRYSPRSRPITLLSELVMRQMPKKPTTLCDYSEEDVCKIVSDQSSIKMSQWCSTHLLVWLPFLPSPWQLRQELRNKGSATYASRLLEVGQYLIAMQYNSTFRAVASETRLVSLLHRYLAILVISPPADWRTSLAFELLAVFPPLLSNAEAIDPGLLATMALRAATAYKPNEKDDLTAKLHLCSASAWSACYTLGNDELIRSHYPVEVPPEPEVTELLSRFESQNSKEKSSAWMGQITILLRSLGYAAVMEALTSSKEAEDPALSESQRLQLLHKVLEKWEARCKDINATRYRLLAGHKPAKGLMVWLEMEASEHHLLVSGVVIILAMPVEFNPQYLYDLIRGIGVSQELQKFVFKHGDDRMDAGETLLISMTNLADVPLSERVLFPAIVTCGYLLEAGMLTMDAHGTALKYWHSMPRRSETSVLALRGGLRLISSVEETHVVPACVKIVTGMLDAIEIWKRAALQQSKDGHSTSSSTPMTLDGEDASAFLDELLRDIFGPSAWADVLGEAYQENQAPLPS